MSTIEATLGLNLNYLTTENCVA